MFKKQMPSWRVPLIHSLKIGKGTYSFPQHYSALNKHELLQQKITSVRRSGTLYRQYHVHDVFNTDSHRSKINCSHIIRYIFRLLFWYHAFQSIPPSGRQGAASHHLQAHSAENLVHPPPTSPSYFFHLSPTPADTITPGWEALVPRQRVWSN